MPPSRWQGGRGPDRRARSATSGCYVLDAAAEPVPIGVPGELHIGGVQVARGYLTGARR